MPLPLASRRWKRRVAANAKTRATSARTKKGHHIWAARNLVGKRLAYIERQKKLHAEAVNVDVRVRAPEGTGPANRHGMPKLPIGQRSCRTGPYSISATCRTFRCQHGSSNRGRRAQPDYADVDGLHGPAAGRRRQRFSLRSTWSRFDNHWRGVRLRDLAELVVPTESARFVLFTGHDISPGTDMPFDECRWRARRKTTCCWCTRGKVSRCRASTAVQSA